MLIVLNPLSPGRHRNNLKCVIFEHMLWIKFVSTSCKLALRWMPLNTFDDKLIFVQSLEQNWIIVSWAFRGTIWFKVNQNPSEKQNKTKQKTTAIQFKMKRQRRFLIFYYVLKGRAQCQSHYLTQWWVSSVTNICSPGSIELVPPPGVMSLIPSWQMWNWWTYCAKFNSSELWLTSAGKGGCGVEGISM